MAANNLPFNFFQMVRMAVHVYNAQVRFEVRQSQSRPWDPEDPPGERPHRDAVKRMYHDVYKCNPAVPEGCHIAPLDEDISKVHAIIVGPKGTPYEGGFFHFLVRFPPDYKRNPPKVKLLTTANNSVRFNPNLYMNGKVCISLLGTWPGPSWGPAQSLYTVLDAIQGVMNKEPYKNEPGMRQVPGESERYNEIICHDTLRVAVCGMLDTPNPTLPESLKSKIEDLFLENYEFYMKRVAEGIERHPRDGEQMMRHPVLQTGGFFSYGTIKSRLEKIHGKLIQQSKQSLDK